MCPDHSQIVKVNLTRYEKKERQPALICATHLVVSVLEKIGLPESIPETTGFADFWIVWNLDHSLKRKAENDKGNFLLKILQNLLISVDYKIFIFRDRSGQIVCWLFRDWLNFTIFLVTDWRNSRFHFRYRFIEFTIFSVIIFWNSWFFLQLIEEIRCLFPRILIKLAGISKIVC